MHLADLLLLGLQRLASDIHLSASAPALARIHGDLQALTPHALEAAEVQQLLHSCMTPAQREQFAAGSDLDFAWSHDGHRFRVHVFHQARGPAAALRLIAARIPSLQELAAPPVLAKLALQPRGLVIVTGPTGAGKSTTLASMLQHRCQQQPCHALTLEDPIEFVHAPAQGLVHQREIGSHCASFAQGLR
ncbi:MAG: type IV pilus twitching motility protein PilT, partial [Comamonas sp.]